MSFWSWEGSVRVGELEASLGRKARGAGGVRAPQVREQTARQRRRGRTRDCYACRWALRCPRKGVDREVLGRNLEHRGWLDWGSHTGKALLIQEDEPSVHDRVDGGGDVWGGEDRRRFQNRGMRASAVVVGARSCRKGSSKTRLGRSQNLMTSEIHTAWNSRTNKGCLCGSLPGMFVVSRKKVRVNKLSSLPRDTAVPYRSSWTQTDLLLSKVFRLSCYCITGHPKALVSQNNNSLSYLLTLWIGWVSAWLCSSCSHLDSVRCLHPSGLCWGWDTHGMSRLASAPYLGSLSFQQHT